MTGSDKSPLPAGGERIKERGFFWLAIFLLFIAFYVRAHNITALPPFNDESLHLRRAEVAWSFTSADASAKLGKLLTYYWIGLFNPERLDSVWVGRTVVSLFALMGLAATYTLGKRFFGAWGGLLALYIAAFAPFQVFFDRLAFSDPLASVLGMIVILVTLTLVCRPQEWEWGLLTGILLWLTVLAKLIAMPFAAMPVLGVVLFSGLPWREALRQYRTTLLWCYISLGVLLSPFLAYALYRQIKGEPLSMVDPVNINTRSPLETVIENAADLVIDNWILIGGLLIIPALVGLIFAARRIPKTVLYVLAGALLPWGLVVVSAGRLATRYLQLGVLPFIVLLTGGLIYLFRELLPVRFQIWRTWGASYLLATVWLFVIAQPFIINAWTDPRNLKLPERDYFEYFSNFTAGYGLMQAAEYSESLEPSPISGRIEVIGILGSCHQVRLYLDDNGPVHLTCVEIDWVDKTMTNAIQKVEKALVVHDPVYLMVEPEFEFTDFDQLPVRHEVLARFPRPFDGMIVEVWRVAPE